MLTSLALIFVPGLALGAFFRRLRLPPLVGMLIAGMIVSPYALHMLDSSVLDHSAAWRQFALVIILTRAGLSLNLEDLRAIGRPAVLMCFLPACAELLGIALLAPPLLGVTRLEAALMGSVLAAVSPAVVVPRMLRISQEGYGAERRIPKLVLAGAAVDDVFVIVVFTSLCSLAGGQAVTAASFLQIPVSIFTGLAAGAAAGAAAVWFFRRFPARETVRVILLLSASFLLLELGAQLETFIPMSGLLAIMGMGIVICQSYASMAQSLSRGYNELWIAAELILFALVGASVDLQYALRAGVLAAAVVAGGLVFRMGGVFLCLLGTRLTARERLFCMLAYTPKATVQAAIGGIPLSMGLACGPIILTVAVLSILITAPLGALAIDLSYQKLLSPPGPGAAGAETAERTHPG